MNNIKNNTWMEYFRVITPFLLLVLTTLGSISYGKLDNIDDKLFKHLTNDDMHTPRSVVVNKAEFQLYQEFRAKEMQALRDGIADLREILMDNQRIYLENNSKLERKKGQI